MKKKIVSLLFAATFILGFLFPGIQPKDPVGGVSTFSIYEEHDTNF